MLRSFQPLRLLLVYAVLPLVRQHTKLAMHGLRRHRKAVRKLHLLRSSGSSCPQDPNCEAVRRRAPKVRRAAAIFRSLKNFFLYNLGEQRNFFYIEIFYFKSRGLNFRLLHKKN